ncbi:MAG: MBL fold metallo-hydrolase [Candidatus Rokuibacteriota bacterium]|nr:MAG: MBL fold metallo-hydrolase [Candidatus Rokubacteria bacterium]
MIRRRSEMRTLTVLLTSVLLFSPFTADAQDNRAALEAAAKALGATGLKSIEIRGAGAFFWFGQSFTAGSAGPQFNVRSFTRVVNYDAAALRDEMVRTRALEPPKGGGPYVRGEHTAVAVLSGDYAWNVTGDAATAAPIALAERQFQLWSTPHGVIKAAMAGKGTMQGRVITFAVPGSFKAAATLDAANLVERVDATMANPVLGDVAVTVSYADYRDFGGMKFPTKIRQSYGGLPALELTVTDVTPNVAADIPVPDNVRQATNPYARVQSQKAADGVWYLTGGTHHSVVIEMSDHVIVVESPLNDDRALAVIKETRALVPNKPIKYLVVSHQHFDHAGGVRAFAGEGVTLITHDASRKFFEQIAAAPATVSPDHFAKSGRKAAVEGVRDRRVLTDGTRIVEIRQIAGIQHADDMLMVYLPKEKFLIEADAYTPPAANAAPMSPPSPFNVNLADNIAKQALAVDQILPLHGRMVPIAELQKAAGVTP